eukprot:Colp12_sorted_trinity150504_noHs@31737
MSKKQQTSVIEPELVQVEKLYRAKLEKELTTILRSFQKLVDKSQIQVTEADRSLISKDQYECHATAVSLTQACGNLLQLLSELKKLLLLNDFESLEAIISQRKEQLERNKREMQTLYSTLNLELERLGKKLNNVACSSNLHDLSNIV